MHVSKVGRLGESLIATGFPSQKRHKNPNIHFYHHITLKTHGIRRAGSAAMDLAYTACGRFDGYWEFNLNPWDTAAGVLLVREAGGIVSDTDGAAFDIASKEVVASNGKLHPALLHELQAVMSGEGLEELPDVVAFGKTRTF
jgi:myo-inositol-1(or 4)-monophosphatase